MNTEERFWSKVTKSDDCWEWTAGRFTCGYGSFSVNGRAVYAHRYSAALHFGPFDQSVVVCHTCDNRNCVRPDHLVLATHKWNAEDREAKGRGNGANRTHCPSGHEYNEANTLYTKKGHRKCRECNKRDCLKHHRKAS